MHRRRRLPIGENVVAWRMAPLFVSVSVLVVLGLTLPAPLETLLNRSREGLLSK